MNIVCSFCILATLPLTYLSLIPSTSSQHNTIHLPQSPSKLDLTCIFIVKIPPRTMFLTQIYGTVLGSFVNYAVMTSIVSSQRDLLLNSDGNTAWSGAQIQSYNTNATSWALAEFLYGTGKRYAMVPIGLAFGSGLVVIHWGFSRVSTFPSSFCVSLYFSACQFTTKHVKKNFPPR